MTRWRSRHRTRKRPIKPGLWQWWTLWRTPLFVLILIGVWWLLLADNPDNEWSSVSQTFGTCGERGRPAACVTDGDTVTLGYGSKARRIRLTGFDAPEIDGACTTEKTTARLAQQALQQWLNRGPFEWSGGPDPARDTYGRELREARRALPDGSHDELADWMIDQKLAEGYGPWQSRNWCD